MNKQWQTVFITGGGSGIGLFLAEKLLNAGIQIALFDLCFSRAVRSRLEVIANGTNYLTFELDVRDSEAMLQHISTAVLQLGPPDLALHCAGIQLARPFEDLTQQEFEQVVAVNLFGSRNFAAAVVPEMKSGAQLAFVSSLAGLLPSYSYAAYNASKFAVVGLAGALRLECKPRNIAVSVICPGEIMTPMVVKELETMHPVTRRMKTFAGTLEIDDACEEILLSLAKRKSMIIPGARAKFAYCLARWFPAIMQRLSERMVVQTLRDNASKTVTHS